MSTDFFRRYLDLLNEASGQPPTDFTPTHFHKNNLGGKIPLMQTPDGKFWWETTATGDDGGPVQKGGARKTIQPWVGNTEDRSGMASVDGEIKDGKPVEYPEGKTWKDTAVTGPGQGGQPPPKEIPHIDPGPLIEPNKNVAPADPPGYRFSNDDALAALAKKIKDGSATTGGNATTKSDSTTSGKVAAVSGGDTGGGGVKIGPKTDNSAEDSGTMGGDARCAKCGTRKMDHQGLNHAFVQAGSNKVSTTAGPGGIVKRGGVSSTPDGQAATPDVSKATAALSTIEKILDKYKIKLKENINRLAPADQMKAWRTLMEAPSSPPNPVLSNMINQLRMFGPPEATSTGGTITQTPSGQTHRGSPRNPNAPSFGTGTSMPTSPYQVPGAGTSASGAPAGASAAAATAPQASALSKLWKGAKKLGSKLALPLTAVVEIFEGYQQISAIPTDIPRDEYRARVTKIVARLVEDFGLFWVGAILGGALAGAFSGGVGTVVGFIAGGAGGIAASYLLGDSVGEISDQIVDKLYGTTGKTSSMSAEDKAAIVQNLAIIQDFVKANPSAVDADLKARIDRVMAATKAAGVTPGQGGQPPEGKKPAPAVPKLPTATSTDPAKFNTTLDGIDKLLKKYNFESQEFDSFFDSLTESEQRRFIIKNLHLLSEAEQMAERRDMLNEAGAWDLGKRGLKWLGRKLYKAGGGASLGGAPVPPTAATTPWWKPGFKTGLTVGVGGTVGGAVYGYFKVKELIGGLLDTIKDPETAKVITISPEDTAAWIQFNKELEAALPDQATYDALPQEVKDRLSMIAARAEAMDKAIKESRAKAQ
jgi:hypothetical protein